MWGQSGLRLSEKREALGLVLFEVRGMEEDLGDGVSLIVYLMLIWRVAIIAACLDTDDSIYPVRLIMSSPGV